MDRRESLIEEAYKLLGDAYEDDEQVAQAREILFTVLQEYDSERLQARTPAPTSTLPAGARCDLCGHPATNRVVVDGHEQLYCARCHAGWLTTRGDACSECSEPAEGWIACHDCGMRFCSEDCKQDHQRAQHP